MDSLSRANRKKILFIARMEKCKCAFSPPNFPLIMIHMLKVKEPRILTYKEQIGRLLYFKHFTTRTTSCVIL